MNPCPVPGVYPLVPAAEYHGWDAASSTSLKTLDRSPMHLKAEREAARGQTDAMVLGSAVHAAVLQPEVFAADFAVAPECDRRTTAGKATWADFLAECEGRTPLKAEQHRCVMAMREAVMAHPSARVLVESAEDFEVSLVWDDDPDAWEGGEVLRPVRCKARPDARVPSWNALLDLKSTTNASKAAFRRTIHDRLYHVQGAFYQRGNEVLCQPVEHFLFVAVESEWPHPVGVYRLQDDALQLGRQGARRLLATYRDCASRNEWPGYGDDIQDVGLPAYAYTNE